jgi:hypothetical protein
MQRCNLPKCVLPAEFDVTLANGGRFLLCKIHRDEARESRNLKSSRRLASWPQFSLRNLFVLVLLVSAASAIVSIGIRSGRPLRAPEPRPSASEADLTTEMYRRRAKEHGMEDIRKHGVYGRQ